MGYEKDKKTFKKFLTASDFESDRMTKHSEIWKQPEKSLTFQMSGSPISQSWLNNAISEFHKLVAGNFTYDELQELLKPFIKKIR